MSVRHITEAETRQLVSARDVLEVCRDALRAHQHGDVAYSQPRMLTLDAPRRYRVKAAALTGHGVAGFRLVASGRAQAIGDVTRLIVLSDVASGSFLATIEEQWIYAARTAAAAYIALEALAPAPLSTVGLVGTGVIAAAFAEIAAAAPTTERLLVAGRTAGSAEEFTRRTRGLHGLQVEALDDVASVMSATPSVVLATSATSPIVEEGMLRPGTTLYSMGAQELADDVYAACDALIVDDWEHVQHKPDVARLLAAGRLTRADVQAELPAIVAGVARGRRSATDTIVVRSEGIASMDVAVAQLVLLEAHVRAP